MRTLLFCLIQICFCSLAFSNSASNTATNINNNTINIPPAEYFSQLPDVQNVSMSPNGEKILSVIRVNIENANGTGIQVTDLKTGRDQIVLFTDNSKYFIGSAFWKDNNTILTTSWYPSKRDTATGWGHARFKTRESRLLIIDVETGKISPAFSKRFLKRYKLLPSSLANIVDTLPDDPDHILMSVNGLNPKAPGLPGYPIVVQVNIKNQKTKTLQTAETGVVSWRTDVNHNIRSAREWDDNVVIEKIKDLNTGKWREIGRYEAFSEDHIDFLGFDSDPNIVYIAAYHNGFKAVFKMDIRNNPLRRELVFADPNYDVSGGLNYSPKRDRVIGIGAEADGGTIFIDPVYKAAQESIDKAMPKTRNFLYSITANEEKFLVYSTGPQESGTYYLGTRNPLKLSAVAYSYKHLTPDILGKVELMNYKSRDGLNIESYLTLPVNSSGKNLPTIMFPHGGPIARDSKAFDYFAQFFASRGYAVLQMNFRGSAGQGYEFFKSGLKNWGKEMQDDIEDGALALIKKGIADPNRICIVGASYGGYAALMGVTKTPDRYKCAISLNGVSNVLDLVRDHREFRASYNLIDDQIGNDSKVLKEISPVNFAYKIKAPVLLIHGELDRQVDIKHSYQMRDALEKAKKNVTFIEQPGEDHFLSNEHMRIKAFKAMEDFLREHLPVH